MKYLFDMINIFGRFRRCLLLKTVSGTTDNIVMNQRKVKDNLGLSGTCYRGFESQVRPDYGFRC